MDRVRELLEHLKRSGGAKGEFLGLLHILIGRQVARADGTVVSQGLSWRDVAAYLKKVRWDKQAVRELGADSSRLPSRDRLRYWYQAITQAGVDSPQAMASADRLAAPLAASGYVITRPGGSAAAPTPLAD
jgi:hypothetical protein